MPPGPILFCPPPPDPARTELTIETTLPLMRFTSMAVRTENVSPL